MHGYINKDFSSNPHNIYRTEGTMSTK